MPVTDKGEYLMSEWELKKHLECKHYTVVEGRESLELTSKVDELMANGFQLHGGVSVAFNRDGYKVMAQAMVRSTAAGVTGEVG